MAYRFITVRAICLALLFAAFGSTGTHAQDWGDAGPGGWLTVPPSDYPAANSVIVFDRATVRVELFRGVSIATLVTKRHVRFKALTRAGVDEIGSYSLSFHENTLFPSFEAQTLCPDGSVVPVNEKDIFVKEDGDYRVRTFAFPALDSGCIVEIRYEITQPYILGYYAWIFSSHLYTLESQFKLEVGCRCQYNYQCTNIPAGRATPHEGWTDGFKADEKYPTYAWRLVNLPPIKSEPYMTCVDDYEAKVQIYLSGIGRVWEELTWLQMGKNYDDYVDAYLTLPRGFRETITKLTKGMETKYDKSKAIYRYVVDEFETRQDSYRPYRHHKDMNGLWDKRYGTAWEKNLLLTEMLHKAHIECWPVLICTRDHARFDPTWKEWDQFSHVLVFVEVEQGGIYLDASSKYCVYGTLPPVCRVDAGLLIDGLKSDLIRVVTNDPVSYRLDQTTIRLDAEGNAACSTNSAITGYLAADYGDLVERTDPDQFLAEVALPGLAKMSETPSDTCWFDTVGRFHMQADYEIVGFAQVMGSALAAAAPDFMFGENPFKSEYRFTNVDFNYAFTYHNIVTLVSDDSTMTVTPPKDVSFNIDGITFLRASVTSGSSVRVESVLKITRPQYTIAEYPLVRKMFRRVAESTGEPFTWQAKSN